MCCNLEYLNMSGWKKLWYVYHHDEVQKKGFLSNYLADNASLPKLIVLPALKRLVVNECPLLEHLCLNLPQIAVLEANRNPKLTIVRIGNEDKTLTKVSLEESTGFSGEMAYNLIKQNPSIISFDIKGSPLDKDPVHQMLIGSFYHDGLDGNFDSEKAMQWYVKAAEQGNVDAQYTMGSLYHYGYGIGQNYEEALVWYFKAAIQGDATAQYTTGMFYHQGYGVAQDYKEAMKWYLKAAEQGNAAAQNSIGDFYCYGMACREKL